MRLSCASIGDGKVRIHSCLQDHLYCLGLSYYINDLILGHSLLSKSYI